MLPILLLALFLLQAVLALPASAINEDSYGKLSSFRAHDVSSCQFYSVAHPT